MLTLRDHGAVIARYTYDAAGNRATYTADGATTVYRYDAQNRPLSAVTAAATVSYGVTAADTSYQGGNGVTVRLTVMEALQVIAYQQYQDSAQWSRIAAANGLASPNADAMETLAGRTLAIPHEASISWQYDSAGNITLYQEIKEGVVLKSVLSQYDQNGHNTLTRTDTTSVTPPSITANLALLAHTGVTFSNNCDIFEINAIIIPQINISTSLTRTC